MERKKKLVGIERKRENEFKSICVVKYNVFFLVLSISLLRIKINERSSWWFLCYCFWIKSRY